MRSGQPLAIRSRSERLCADAAGAALTECLLRDCDGSGLARGKAGADADPASATESQVAPLSLEASTIDEPHKTVAKAHDGVRPRAPLGGADDEFDLELFGVGRRGRVGADDIAVVDQTAGSNAAAFHAISRRRNRRGSAHDAT
jgi:hypothetical protein